MHRISRGTRVGVNNAGRFFFLVLVVRQENILTAVRFIPTTYCLQTRSQHWSRNLARPIGVKHGEIETRGEARGVRSNAMVFVYPRRMFVRRTIFLRPKQAIKLQFQVAALRDAFGEALHFFQEFLLHYLSPARSEKIRSNIAYRNLLKPMSLAFSRKH